MTKTESTIVKVCTVGVLAAAVAAMFITFVAVKQRTTFNDRWVDIKPTGAIPHEALHAKALEILQGRTVAADEALPVDPCVAFTKTTMEKTTCK